MARLIFLYGPPACGKLTIARELAKITELKVFHNHLVVDLATSIFEFASDPFVELREHVWLSCFRRAISSDTSIVFTFSPEKSVPATFITNTIATVEDAGGEVVFIELTCSEAELERRMESDSRKQHGKLVDRALYIKLREEGMWTCEGLPEEPAMSIDTTSLDPVTAASRIASAL